MIKFSKVSLIALLFCHTLPALSQAQTDKASLEGLVLDAATRQPVVGAVVQALTPTGRATQTKTLAPDGSFKLTLSPKESYRIVTQASGFTPAEEQLLAFSEGRVNHRFGKMIYLSRTPPNTPPVAATPKATIPKATSVSAPAKPPITLTDQTVDLRAIQFTQSTAEMVPEAKADLDRILTFLNQNPTVSIELAGHTDNQGDFDQNVALSRQRAEAVKTYLVGQGVVATRIRTRGYGGTRPVATNNYEKSRQFNRRVEMRIIK